jgi:hypothetical protein
LGAWLTPLVILLMAAVIIIQITVLITGNWNRWLSSRESQLADLRSDLTLLGGDRDVASCWTLPDRSIAGQANLQSVFKDLRSVQ